MSESELTDFKGKKPDLSSLFTDEEKEIARNKPAEEWTDEMRAKIASVEKQEPYVPATPPETPLAVPRVTRTKGELVEGDEKEMTELMEPTVRHYTPGTLADYELINRFKLAKGIDYYTIGDKAIFTKEGLLKLIPLVRVEGFGVSHEVKELIDEPNYKRVKIRTWIGPKDNPIRVAEATCDWRSELNEASIILTALKSNRISETALIVENGQYSLNWLKHPDLLRDLLRNNVFALRITEGKALRRAWSEIAGVTTIPEQEIKSLTNEVKTLQDESQEIRRKS